MDIPELEERKMKRLQEENERELLDLINKRRVKQLQEKEKEKEPCSDEKAGIKEIVKVSSNVPTPCIGTSMKRRSELQDTSNKRFKAVTDDGIVKVLTEPSKAVRLGNVSRSGEEHKWSPARTRVDVQRSTEAPDSKPPGTTTSTMNSTSTEAHDQTDQKQTPSSVVDTTIKTSSKDEWSRLLGKKRLGIKEITKINRKARKKESYTLRESCLTKQSSRLRAWLVASDKAASVKVSNNTLNVTDLLPIKMAERANGPRRRV